MIVTAEQLLFEHRNFKDPHHKIQSLVKKGELIPLKRGLYETDPKVPGYLLANAILGPSYLSFEYALSYHGMIPERVNIYTSASFKKRKTVEITNQFGTYKYNDVPEKVFPYGYTRVLLNGRPLLIALKEKALCDQLCAIPPIRGYADFVDNLFDGLRIDEDIFDELDAGKIYRIAPLYHKTNLDQLVKLLERRR
ncbi:MAG: hypothetical protein HUJ76_11320 [Parasporobacterium sp.]|nr:hypothetical protein [Parasporobacterium sp.]